jgi:RelB Antitoxin alpha helical domain
MTGISNRLKIMTPVNSYPFAQEFITDSQGKVRKVILDIADYQKLLEALEDEGLYRAMTEVRHETPLNFEEALAALEQP